MTTDLTFITNEEGEKLSDRFSTLIKDTRFFDCLVGYFYVSGFLKSIKSGFNAAFYGKKIRRKMDENMEKIWRKYGENPPQIRPKSAPKYRKNWIIQHIKSTGQVRNGDIIAQFKIHKDTHAET